MMRRRRIAPSCTPTIPSRGSTARSSAAPRGSASSTTRPPSACRSWQPDRSGLAGERGEQRPAVTPPGGTRPHPFRRDFLAAGHAEPVVSRAQTKQCGLKSAQLGHAPALPRHSRGLDAHCVHASAVGIADQNRVRIEREDQRRRLVAALDTDIADHVRHHNRWRRAVEVFVLVAEERARLEV